MFITLTKVQKGEAVGLQQPIDNRGGGLRVGLRSITYTAGWYNVLEGESISWAFQDNEPQTALIPPGLYGFDDLVVAFGAALKMAVNRVNGLVWGSVIDGVKVRVTDGLLSLLGLDDGLGGRWLGPGGNYKGDRPMDFATTKSLHIHLDQLNTAANVVDGAPSTLLATVGVGSPSFGDNNTVYVARPEFKRLMTGTVAELKLDVRDDRGNTIDNHGLPISLTLEYEHIRP